MRTDQLAQQLAKSGIFSSLFHHRDPTTWGYPYCWSEFTCFKTQVSKMKVEVVKKFILPKMQHYWTWGQDRPEFLFHGEFKRVMIPHEQIDCEFFSFIFFFLSNMISNTFRFYCLLLSDTYLNFLCWGSQSCRLLSFLQQSLINHRIKMVCPLLYPSPFLASLYKYIKWLLNYSFTSTTLQSPW